jgi:hypothetical protein
MVEMAKEGVTMTLGDRCDAIVRLIDETLVSVGAATVSDIDTAVIDTAVIDTAVMETVGHPGRVRPGAVRFSPPAPPLDLRSRRSRT